MCVRTDVCCCHFCYHFHFLLILSDLDQDFHFLAREIIVGVVVGANQLTDQPASALAALINLPVLHYQDTISSHSRAACRFVRFHRFANHGVRDST